MAHVRPEVRKVAALAGFISNDRHSNGSARKWGVSRLAFVLGALALIIVAYAWVDGGREPIHEIAVPVAVPAGVGQ